MAPLSPTQEKVAAALPIFPACLSILGSSTIIYMIRRKGKRGTFQRIISVMSVIDIVASTSMAIMGFLLPADGDRAWAVGNSVSCSTMGFLAQVGMASFLYNSCLNLYYSLMIVGNKSEVVISRAWEPWMHIIGLGYPVVTAFVGLALEIYSEADVGMSCWVTADDTITGFIFAAPLFLELVFLFANSLTIFCKVRRTFQASPNYSGALTQQRIHDVAIQATLYVAAAYSVVFGEVIVRIFEASGYTREDESLFYWAIVVSQMTYPLQGFWNFAAYIRPRYVRFRRTYKIQSRWWCFRNSILSLSIERPALPTHTYTSGSRIRMNSSISAPEVNSKISEPAVSSEWSEVEAPVRPSQLEVSSL